MGRKVNQEIIDKAINEYKNGASLKECLSKYNLKERTLYRYLSKNELVEPLKLDEELISEALKDYKNNNLTATECAAKYNIGRTTLLRYISKNNINKNFTTTSREYNRDYFENIDSEEKAYWLGFIAADGSVTRDNSNLDIGLQRADKEHLSKFLNCIGGDINMITDGDVLCSLNNKMYPRSRVIIASKKICSDLNNLGIHGAKSSSLDFPNNILEDLMRHYLRGYFDGDGGITETNNIYQISLIATNEFLNSFKDYILKLEITKTKLEPRTANMAVWKKKGHKQIRKFLDYIYKDSTIFLDRKYNSYLEFCRLETKATEVSR